MIKVVEVNSVLEVIRVVEVIMEVEVIMMVGVIMVVGMIMVVGVVSRASQIFGDFPATFFCVQFNHTDTMAPSFGHLKVV